MLVNPRVPVAFRTLTRSFRLTRIGLVAAGAARYRRFLFWLGRRQLFNWLGPRVFAPVDTWLYPRLHGAVVSAGPPVLPLLMLTTRGRQSGRKRAVPLLYLQRTDGLLVVASNWGKANHPAWSANLLANPTATVQIGAATYPVTAHLLTSDEKARLWPELRRFCPVWDSYAAHSGRDLRVFSLTGSQSSDQSCVAVRTPAEQGENLDHRRLIQQ